MKSLFLCVALATPALAQSTQPSFEWKLRLTKGQTWTQTATTRTTSFQDGFKATRIQIVTLKNDVVNVAPTFFQIRTTFLRFDESMDSTLANTDAFQEVAQQQLRPALVGGSFTWKQARDGNVFDVLGAKELAARQTIAVRAPIKYRSEAEAEALKRYLLTDEELRLLVAPHQRLFLPPTSLVAGQPYTFSMQLSRSLLGVPVNIRRTLRSFDSVSAIFDDAATISFAPTQIAGARPTHVVLLTRDAARVFYYAASQKQLIKRYGQPVPLYLSKNGGVYYRQPNTHLAIFILPPSPGQTLTVTEEDAAPFKDSIGYNNQNTGKTFADYFTAAGSVGLKASPAPAKQPAFPKMFLVMNGTISGQSTVDANSGLLLKSVVTTTIKGKISVVQSNGTKQTVPLDSSTQTTIETR